jgi:hypothetical protein
MSFPDNITKLDLLKAIEKIDKGGIPAEADSQYYDLVFNGKRYPPKVVVSCANIFANGEELDMKNFDGGLGTPCFKLLEQNGFIIEKKNNPLHMTKIKVYEIKTSSAEDTRKLLSPDGKYFYWYNSRFKGDDLGDEVYIINRKDGWALYTHLAMAHVPSVYNDIEKTSSFNHQYNSYTVSDPNGRYKYFIRFDIKSKVNIPSDWNWQTQLGSSEIFDLWKPGIDVHNGRFEKIDDLEKLFLTGIAYETLEEARRLLNQPINLNPDIKEAIKSKKIQELINSSEFFYELAKKKFEEFKDYKEPSSEFYKNLLDSFNSKNIRFTEFMNGFQVEQNEHQFLSLVAELVSYCDTNAANKNTLNKYDDKRVLAKSGVYQNDWLRNILKYKISNNDSLELTQSVKNALDYLNNPLDGITMLSSNHREMISKTLLKQTDYNPQSFINSIKELFKPYDINPKNSENLGVIISFLLYHFPKIKELWFERVSGLIVCDNTGWIEKAIIELSNYKKMTFWWDKSPSGGARVLKLLRDTLDTSETNSFYIYYSVNQNAKYRSRVIDFATAKDFSDKKWNKNGDVGWYHSNFSEYSETNSRGNLSSAKIVFLVDELVKLEEPIGMENFEFFGELSPPTQNNLQPYVEMNAEEILPRKVWFVCQGESYSEEKGKKHLWAPSENKAGSPRIFWENVLKVKKGDIIFNYSDGIKGVSIALTDGYPSVNPYNDSNWSNNGYKVDIDLTEFTSTISAKDISTKKDEFETLLKNVQNKPFNVDGKVNQGYLYEFTKEAGRLVRDIYNAPFGNEIIDSFFDEVTLLPKPNTMETKEIINYVHKYIASKGYKYQYEEIANFYLALKAKPFVILAGISGTGKTQLPRKFAAALGMEDNQVIQIPVRLDWTDGSELLGYTGLDGLFHSKDLTLSIQKANEHPKNPYFFILDEMNLARVEHYFSDFLSVIETREKLNGKITTDPILRKETLQGASNAKTLEGLIWPQNLYLIGTVNMDETTHTFSRKVLDRANSIEMNEVDLSWLSTTNEKIDCLKGITNELFVTEFVGSKDISEDERQQIQSEIELLKDVNEILKEADLHFAYRVRDEVAFYLIINNKQKLLDPKDAIDFQLMQKVLPKIHGSSERVQKVLVELINLLEGKEFKSENFEYDEIIKMIDIANLKFRRSTKKILFMLKRFEEDRFTSFWL